MNQPSENEIQKAIIEWLQWNKVFAWRNNTGMISMNYKGKTRMFKAGLKGSADIIGILKGGIFLAIEVKKPGKKLTDVQKEFLDKVRELGGIAFVACDVETVEKELKQFCL